MSNKQPIHPNVRKVRVKVKAQKKPAMPVFTSKEDIISAKEYQEILEKIKAPVHHGTQFNAYAFPLESGLGIAIGYRFTDNRYCYVTFKGKVPNDEVHNALYAALLNSNVGYITAKDAVQSAINVLYEIYVLDQQAGRG